MLRHILRRVLDTPRSKTSSRKVRTSRLAGRRSTYHPAIDPLEDRCLLSVSAPGVETALVASPAANTAEVVGKYLFYNNSWFDGNDPAINAADDGAIATDKAPLVVGQKASFANYSSYAAGINGVMVDLAGLTETPTLSDFDFHVGNSNNPNNWAAATDPIGFSVRPGAGVDGSTRVTFTWADGTIRNDWLQVTVRPNQHTGLAAPDVFFFGNAVGEVGDRPNLAFVNASDQLAVRANSHGLLENVPVTSRYDFNRDSLVDNTDELIAQCVRRPHGHAELDHPGGSRLQQRGGALRLL